MPRCLTASAISKANAKPLPVIYEPWVFNDVAGGALISPILGKIDKSPFVIADITYLNLNVVYEIGFAIGRNKRAFLVRHKHTEGDKQLVKAVGIFDTLGYHEYETFNDLKDRLCAHIEDTHLHVSKELHSKFPVYIVEPSFRDDCITTAISRIRKARYPYRSYNGDNDLRMSASDTLRQVSAASGVVLPFQDLAIDGARPHNIRCMFVAGLSEGMGKPTLLLCPSAFEAPLDIKDEITPFKTPHDIAEAIAEFCPLIAEYASKTEPSGIDTQTLLEALGIGDTITASFPSGSAFHSILVFVLTNYHAASPNDPNAAIPSAVVGQCSWTTSNANDFLFGIVDSNSTTPDSGWTLLSGANAATDFKFMEGKFVTATQSGTTAPTINSANTSLCYAIQQGP